MIKFKHSPEMDDCMSGLNGCILDNLRYMDLIEKWKGEIVSDEMAESLKESINRIYPNRVDSLIYSADLCMQDDYNKTVNLEEVNIKGYKVEKVIVPTRLIDHMAFIDSAYVLDAYTPVGYYDKDLHLHVLKDSSGEVYMSVTHSEIASMAEPIQKARGKVCTVGLGIGYFVFKCAQKAEVEKVVVYEKSEDLIHLFKSSILTQFPKAMREKIEVRQGDIFEVYPDKLEGYDYVFLDTWKNNDDGLEVFYVDLMEKSLPKAHIDFWIEDSLLYVPRLLLTSYLEVVYYGTSVAHFMETVGSLDRRVAIKVNRYCKQLDITIETPEQLVAFIGSKDIIRNILAYKRK